MRLDEWGFILRNYPKTYPNEIYPFKRWDQASPTKSLLWYDAYNATKHDREDNLDKATFENVINATAGLMAMGIAQFGSFYFRKSNDVTTFCEQMHFTHFGGGNWLPEERYVRPPTDKFLEWKPICYF